MYFSEDFVKAQHRHRMEQLKKSYPTDSRRGSKKPTRSRTETPHLALEERKAW